MIRAEDVADLREGDVVELTFSSGSVIRGPLTENRHCGELSIADVGWTVRDDDGAMGFGLERYAETLTVVSRAPRLYVNHPRTEPVDGDVVRDADSDAPDCWDYSGGACGEDDSAKWALIGNIGIYATREQLPDRLRLLIDGTTGQVVP